MLNPTTTDALSSVLADEEPDLKSNLLNPSPNSSPQNSGEFALLNKSAEPSLVGPGPFSSQFSLEYDENNGFPATPESQRLPWQLFLSDVYSSQADAQQVILDVIEENYEEWIDLRPYMIEHPHKCTIYDNFQTV